MLRVGLTGGIASGKSHVLRRLARQGLHTLDLDRTSHALLAKEGAGYAPVVAAFGSGILDAEGRIDRKALGGIVFADAAARARLNAIVHPLVRAEEQRWVESLAVETTVAVTDAALLVEAGLHLRFDRLVVVWCSPDEQLQRLVHRDGIATSAARARIAAQMPVAEKRAFAHLEIDTSGEPSATDAKTDAVATALQRLAACPPPPARPAFDRALAALTAGPRDGPRGLTAARVLHELAVRRTLELESLARLLEPPTSAPWYQASADCVVERAPASLAVVLALWSLARRGFDPPFAASCAASVARLTHRDDRAVARAALFAVAMAHALATGREPHADDWPAWRSAAAPFANLAAEDDWLDVSRGLGSAEPVAVDSDVTDHRLAAALKAAAGTRLFGDASPERQRTAEAAAEADLASDLRRVLEA